MGQARVLPIATLLPNGFVIVLAGAARGRGGYGTTSFPALTAEMYDPNGTPGARWTTLAKTQVRERCLIHRVGMRPLVIMRPWTVHLPLCPPRAWLGNARDLSCVCACLRAA
jgi:hypothetical protein